MNNRKYSVSEIDQMRQTISAFGWVNGGSYYPGERAKEIEERLRTYMIAGIGPADLHEEMSAIFHKEITRQFEIVGEEWKDGKLWKIHANGQRSWSSNETGPSE